MSQAKPTDTVQAREVTMPVGIVIRRVPSNSRWIRWTWKAVAVLPGAGEAEWKPLREEDGATEFHATTVDLTLHRAETEAYLTGLSMEPPAVWVILRPSEDADDPHEVVVHGLTASPFEAQDYLDSGEEIVEPVPMPPSLLAWVSDFVGHHHVEEEFKKRRRDRVDIDAVQDGVGDPRIRQDFDVYRAPGALKPKGSVH